MTQAVSSPERIAPTVRPRGITTARRLAAEAIGTFWLVLGGCGTAVLATGADLAAAFLSEALLTAIVLTVILGATDERSPAAFAPLSIGLALTLTHLVSIPIDNTSVNPARSTGPALFAGGWALAQLWLFWLAPLTGAAAAGLGGRWLFAHRDEDQSPGPISDTPVELIVATERSSD